MPDLVKGKSRELEPLVSQPGFALTFFEKHLLDCYASIPGYQGIFLFPSSSPATFPVLSSHSKSSLYFVLVTGS